MAQRARYIQPSKTTHAPTCVVSVIVQTELHQYQSGDRAAVYRLRGIHVAESHLSRSRWTPSRYHYFDSGTSLHDWLEEFASAHRRTHVYSDSVIDTLTLSSFWPRIEQRGCVLLRDRIEHDGTPTTERQIIRGEDGAELDTVEPSDAKSPQYIIYTLVGGVNSEIVRYSTLGKSIQWVRNSQYCVSSEDEVADAISYKWSARYENDASTATQAHGDRDRCLLWLKFHQQLCDWWRDSDGGVWGPTTASLSYSFLKHRLASRTLLQHNCMRSGVLEEAAIIGGRRSIWYAGNIGTDEDWRELGENIPPRSEHGTIADTMSHHDVRSMYPFLLARMEYPVRLISHIVQPDIDSIRDVLKTHGCICTVIVRSNSGEYPVRTPSRIIYPIGQYRTTLCGAEILTAVGNGEVVHCDSMSIYEMGTPFKDTCLGLLDKRRKFRDTNERCWEMLTKMLANSMSGKLAQRTYDWVARPDVPPLVDWGHWPSWVFGDTEVHHYRSVAGMVWERTLREASIRPMGAAYAYLCSYGRWMMRCIRANLPQRTCISQDTDGVWALSAAHHHLYPDSDVNTTDAGQLRSDKTVRTARFFGAQHYWYGDGWVLSGIASPSYDHRTGSISARVRQGTALTALSTPEPLVYEYSDSRVVSRIQHDGTIGEDGWIVPTKLWETDHVIG
jgi:DNA polymerase type B, organellar and viral